MVLGASNVSRGLARLAAVTTARVSEPLDLFVVAGHGRSYGVNSRVAMRRLPSILASGLWRALERERGTVNVDRQPLALVTDIGNDLLYGFPAAQVARWVAECLRRLAEHGARTVVTAASRARPRETLLAPSTTTGTPAAAVSSTAAMACRPRRCSGSRRPQASRT